MPLTDIDSARDAEKTYLPLLLAVFTFGDASVLRLASFGLAVSEGGVQYGGNNYFGRIISYQLGEVQGFDSGGIDIVPRVTMEIADADKAMWSNYSQTKGFGGAEVELTFVFHDVLAGTFSSDSILKFKGICDPAQAEEDVLRVTAVNRLNLQRRVLPVVTFQRRCPWVNPTTTAQRAEASDEDSIFFECGETRDLGTAPPCEYTKATCTQPNRRGGIEYEPPTGGRSRDYVSGNWIDIRNNPSEAKYGQPIPMVYGTAWVDARAVNVIGDGNSTRGEAVVCLGEVEQILRVVVNDVELPAANDITGATNYNVADPLMRYNVVNRGDRDGGPNLDTPYDGNGDSYGSMATILWVVPRRVAESSSTPRVRVLVKGPRIRVYTSPGSHSKQYTENPVWILLDLLIWSGLKYADIDLQSFVDAAAIANASISYTDQYGNSSTHPRYQCSLVLGQRRSAADVIRNVRQGFGAILIPNSTTGKLQILIKGTVSQQHGGAYVREFTRVLRRDGRSTVRVIPAPLASTPNRVTFDFINSERDWAADSLAMIDADAIKASGQEVSAKLDVDGIGNLDQAKRIAVRFLAEQIRGNAHGNPTGSDLLEFEDSFGAVRVEAGDLCRLSNTHLALSNVPIRVLSIQPSHNFETVKIVAARHNDAWYSDTFGQDGDPSPGSQFRDRLERPAFGWGPRAAAPHASDSMFDETDQTFFLEEYHEAAADSTSIAAVGIRGLQPVNIFSTLSPPIVGRQGTVGGGTVPGGGWVYYTAVCAVDSDGLLTAPSSLCETVITAAGSSYSVVTPILDWPAGAVGYKLFAGTSPQRLTFQVENSGTPASITMTAYKQRDYGMPDIEMDRMTVKVKRVWHSGVWGQECDAVSSGTITILEAGWTTNEWAGRDVSVLGLKPGREVPVANFSVVSNTADTLTVTPDPQVLGIVAGDVIVMRSRATVGADYLEDLKWENSLENEGAGLAVDEEIGRLLRIISGTGRGDVYRITANTATRVYIEGGWLRTPDATTRYIIEDPAWQVAHKTDGLNNSDPLAEITLSAEITNYERQTILVGVFTVDGGSNESFESLSPIREIYIFGRGFIGSQIWQRGFGIVEGTDLTAADDTHNHIDVEAPGVPFEVLANQKDWPTSEDTITDILYRAPGGSWVSIFPDGNENKIVIPNGNSAQQRFTGMRSGLTFTQDESTLLCGQLKHSIIQGTVSAYEVVVRWWVSPEAEGQLSGSGGEGSLPPVI